MDCRQAQQTLEVVRPDSADLTGPELCGVAAHLDRCAVCQSVFEQSQTFDRELAELMRNVPVPSGLRARLLAELQLSPASEGEQSTGFTEKTPQPAAPSRPQGQWTRRQWVRAFGALAGCIALAVLSWLQFTQSPQPALSLNALLLDVTRPGFTPGTAPATTQDRLPDSMLQPQSLRQAAPVAYSQGGRAVAAAREFRFSDRQGNLFEALLLTINTSQTAIADPEHIHARSFTEAEPEYHRGVAARVWSEGEIVYVCLVRNAQGPDALALLTPHSFAT